MTTDHRARSARNAFAGNYMDRAHDRRRNEGWIGERLADPATRLVFLWRSKHLTTPGDPPRPAALPPAGLEAVLRDAASVALLGQDHESAYFAVDLPPGDAPPADLAACGEFRDLRELAPVLPAAEAGLLAQARALAHWHRRQRFCGTCGSPTRSAEAGHVRTCTSASCREQHFPRTDPAVIVLVASGDRCLLGRQAAWPQRRFSALAGFVEPGESLEEAVAREVREETGVTVTRVGYHSSQPWPFPASLMLGFTAEAEGGEIQLDDELEEARWFTREELRQMLASGAIGLPAPISIAYRLIEHWFDRTGPERLGEIPQTAW